VAKGRGRRRTQHTTRNEMPRGISLDTLSSGQDGTGGAASEAPVTNSTTPNLQTRLVNKMVSEMLQPPRLCFIIFRH